MYIPGSRMHNSTAVVGRLTTPTLNGSDQSSKVAKPKVSCKGAHYWKPHAVQEFVGESRTAKTSEYDPRSRIKKVACPVSTTQ